MIMRIWIIITLFLTGCASLLISESEAVLKRYPTVVFEDGINLEEAKLIAQRELIRSNEVAIYELARPQVVDHVADLPHSENYWFIFFNERSNAAIKYIFMAVIDKKDGRVKFANDYAEEKRWILEAAMLRDTMPGKR